MSVDRKTSHFYDAYARELDKGVESPISAMSAFIFEELSVGATVLDVGAGSGRDVAAMLARGLDAYGVEPNDSMRAKAITRFPQLADRMVGGAVPDLGRPFHHLHPEGFDAVVCSAVLMHLDDEELPAAVADLDRQLRRENCDRSGGATYLFISLPELDPLRLLMNRDQDGRKFFNHKPERVCQLLRDRGLALKRSKTSNVVLQTSGTLWHTLVFEQCG